MQYIDKGADISADGVYRYRLWREWRGADTPDSHWEWLTEDDNTTIAVDGAGAPLGDPKSVVFVMLNPSTADGDKDDPTIRRCVSFAQRFKYDRLEVVNLFAYRATDPSVILDMRDAGHLKSGLPRGSDPVGPNNEGAFQRALSRAGLVICAWGNNGNHMGQDEEALGWIAKHSRVNADTWCLGEVTKLMQPRHPLYVRADAPLLAYNGRPKPRYW